MLKRLFGSIREYRKPSIISMAIVTLEVIMECLIPFITRDLIDYFSSTSTAGIDAGTGMVQVRLFDVQIASSSGLEIGWILMYAGILVFLAGISLLLGALAARSSAIAATGFAKNLRHDIFGNIQNFSFENIDKFSTSSLITRLSTDINNVQMAYMMSIRMAVKAPLMLIFSVTMSFTINWVVALIFVAVIPILIALFVFIIIKAMPIFRRVFKRYDKLNLRVQENVNGVRVVKAYVREDYEIHKFETASEDVRRDFVKAERRMAVISPVMNFVIYSMMIAIATVGAIIIVNSNNGAVQTPMGALSTGGISSALTYSMMAFMSLMMLAMVIVMISMAIESAQRISEVLKEESTITSPENGLTEVTDGDVEFNGVYFAYAGARDKNALKNINLKIKSGETIGIIGSTGASKTTLVQLLPRLYDAAAGEVKVGGRNVKEYDLASLRKGVAMVLQKNVLFSGTIKENLRWGNPEASDEQIVNACKAAEADDFIRSFTNGYDTVIEQSGTNVSGGQRQRLCIARSLLTDPKVLIFDDSTSAVDTKTDARIRASLEKYSPNITKIIIAQRAQSVQDADKIVVMDDGEIEAVGTHNELLKTSKIYQEVFYTQNKSLKDTSVNYSGEVTE